MPFVLPTIEQIENYLHDVEELVINSFSAATPDLPRVTEAINRLWQDVLRHSPQAMPGLKGLGAFEVPPPPPPPPPPKSFWENSADWVADHPWTTAGIGVGIIGTGLLVGYASPQIRRRARAGAKKHASAASTERRQVVVVLRGDTPLGLPLIYDLEKKGYIVIASVSTPEAVEQIESRSHGYVRALVLDPNEPQMIPYFLRSLASTMSRRFPITAAGDPHAPAAAHLYVHSVVSLLSLPCPSTAVPPSPLEHVNLHGEYLSYLQATHIAPLQLLQALLPLLRATPARAKDARANGLGRQSIIVCLPAIDARVGLPFTGAQAMSAAATLRGVDVLRREIRAAGLSGIGSEAAEAMRNIKVTVVDVGAVGLGEASDGVDGLHHVADQWTPSEQAAYGAAFDSMLEHGAHPPPAQTVQPAVAQQTIPEKAEGPGTDSDPEREASEAGSEADVESNEGYGSGVGESWPQDSVPHILIATQRMGISLWLVPRASQAEKIKFVMRLRPSSTLSPSSFPDFHPHVTVATSPDLAALRAALPADLRPIPVRFKRLQQDRNQGKYFMAVYVVVHSAPGSALETLREHFRAQLGAQAVPQLAHMSLYYIDDADREERGRIAEKLRSELRVLESGTGEESKAQLACVDDNVEGEQEPEILDGFDGEEIWVVKCDGPVPTWEILEKIPLTR
ncbi:hypothetical protein FKP32DRAFT_1631088 [Trametes sanguinea]|nr:hypothetical protein FKP32DRAFT_1631088 [Trametes sanguinea]